MKKRKPTTHTIIFIEEDDILSNYGSQTRNEDEHNINSEQ